MYLVDTSVWVNYLRGLKTSRVEILKTLLTGDEVVGITPVILQEILQGADSEERFNKWLQYFKGLCCYTIPEPESHIAAARIYQACRKKGRTPRSSNDCLIAQTAIEHGLILLHDDRDFEAIAAVTNKLRLYLKG